jgi:hypothetical protein
MDPDGNAAEIGTTCPMTRVRHHALGESDDGGYKQVCWRDRAGTNEGFVVGQYKVVDFRGQMNLLPDGADVRNILAVGKTAKRYRSVLISHRWMGLDIIPVSVVESLRSRCSGRR